MRSVLLPFVLAAAAAAAQTLPVFPPKNAPQTFFGTVVDDPYRPLEEVKDPAVAAWMKAHSDYAQATLQGLKGYAALKARVAELDNAVAARVDTVRRTRGGEIFFTRRGATENTFKLYMRAADGRETMLADPDEWQKETGKPHAVNYSAPSPDASLVAFGVSAAGSEAASIYVMETATRKRIGAPIDRAQYPQVSWNPDGKSFFFMRQQKLEPGMPATERYQNGRNYLYTVGADPESGVLVLGPGVSPRVSVERTDFPYVVPIPGSKFAIAGIFAGVQNEIALYAAPLETVGKPGTPWAKICDAADKVTDFAVKGDHIYLLTYRDSPRYSIIRTSLAAPDLKNAKTVVAAGREVLTNLAAASDALYFEPRDGAAQRLKRLAWKATQPVELRLPLEGAASIMSASPDVAGALVSLAAWTRAREIFAVDAAGHAKNTGLQPLRPFRAPTDLVASEVRVKSHDGAMVPLSIIHKNGIALDGSNPTLLYGYGSYGITEEPGFNPTRLAWLERGGVYAVANVRGSAVYGQDWYKAGYKATKPNTGKDLIACPHNPI